MCGYEAPTGPFYPAKVYWLMTTFSQQDSINLWVVALIKDITVFHQGLALASYVVFTSDAAPLTAYLSWFFSWITISTLATLKAFPINRFRAIKCYRLALL